MNKNIVKILKITIIFIILLNVFTKLSFADNWVNPDDYKPDTIQSNNEYDDVATKVGKVLGAIQVIGMIVSVAVLMILGIKFMLGSVEEKASYKRAFIPYLIGAAILFSGTALPNLIYSWSHK